MQKSFADRVSAFFEPAQLIDRLFSVLLPFLAVALALLIGAIMLLLLDEDPIEGYEALYNGALGLSSEDSPALRVNARAETLIKAIPLMFVGIGICIAFRGGVINIGGEGQMMMGAVVGTATALTIEDWPFTLADLPLIGDAIQIIAIDLGIPRLTVVGTSLLMGFLAGAFWGAIAGFLKAYFDVNEILSTIMLNQIALSIMTYLLNGPMQDPRQQARAGGIAKTIRLPEHAQLPRWTPLTDVNIRLHLGLPIAVVLAVLVYILLWHTTLGYRIRAVGKSQRASRYAGIQVKRQMLYSMFLAGGFAGLAGIVQVLGLSYLLQTEGSAADFTGSAGFNGIVAALFGGLHPIGTIFASILFGGLLVGGQRMQRTIGVEASLITALNGIVVVFVVSAQIFILRRKRRRVSEQVGKEQSDAD